MERNIKMDLNVELVYGFNFSYDEYPKTGFKLSEDVVEILEEEELISFVYSGYSDSLLYIGERLSTFGEEDCAFSSCEKFMKKLNSNQKKYDDNIIKKIDKIIDWLESDSATNLIEDGDLEESDVEEAIKYFKKLKTKKPSRLTITGIG